MSGLIYALALFGCADDGTMCERLKETAQTYESRVACEMAASLEMHSDLVRRADYPTVIGQCMTNGQWAALESGPIDLSDQAVQLASRATSPEG